MKIREENICISNGYTIFAMFENIFETNYKNRAEQRCNG